MSSAHPGRSGSTESLPNDRNLALTTSTWISCDGATSSSESFIPKPNNSNDCVGSPADSGRTAGVSTNEELESSNRNSACLPQRLSSFFAYCIRSRSRRRNLNGGASRSRTSSYCQSKMIRILVPLLLLFGISISYSMLPNGSVGNREKLMQSNTTIHTNFKMREPPRLRAVPFSDFKRAMRSTYNATQFLRIFAGKEATVEQLDMLLGNRRFHESERPHSDNTPGRNVRENGDDDGEFVMSSRSTETVIDKALEHVHEMMRSPLNECKYPQPEIVYVQDNEAKNRVYFPSCTVLHRCRNVTGCCKNTSSVCGPRRVQIISKYFVVLDFASKNPTTTRLNTKMVEVRQFMNHTECECKEIIGLPGCRQSCPSPFKKTRVGLKCECECTKHHQNCLLIKDGLKPLHERSLVCIKNRDCQRPNCRYGFFNVNTGFCPRIQSGFNRNRRRYRQKKNRRNG